MTVQSHCLSVAHSRTHPHTHTACSRCWQAAEQLSLINRLICRPFCAVLFSFNKVLLCYCYCRRGNMEKCRKLLRRSTALTNHTSYCCVRAIIARRIHACESVCLCVKLVLLYSWGCFGRLAGASDGKLGSNWHNHGFSRWPFTQKVLSPSVHTFSHSLLNMLQLLPSSICVCVLLFCLQSNDFPALQPSPFLNSYRVLVMCQIPVCFFYIHVFNMGVVVRSQCEVVSSMWCLCFFKQSHLLWVLKSVFMEYICCQSWGYSAESQGQQCVKENVCKILK